METALIRVENVSKVFKKEVVLDDISVSFEKGKIHGIIGRNGSGKTVLFKCICGFVPTSSGTITVNNQIIGKDTDIPDDIGIIIETPGFLPNYSGYKNLKMLAGIRNEIGKAEIREAMTTVGLDWKSKKTVKKYSLGMRQRLGIAQAIMDNPKILILDEPMNGLDKKGVAEMREVLKGLREKGKMIILASHNSEDIKELCDCVYEMDGGKLEQKK
ncbi:MAG: ATP-binding cassette domain-containing protein [Lachnospiraceae bacterium]|nr:ATP-binding cassette domain-containing protein [Lachnospiraceae bacterium]